MGRMRNTRESASVAGSLLNGIAEKRAAQHATKIASVGFPAPLKVMLCETCYQARLLDLVENVTLFSERKMGKRACSRGIHPLNVVQESHHFLQFPLLKIISPRRSLCSIMCGFNIS